MQVFRPLVRISPSPVKVISDNHLFFVLLDVVTVLVRVVDAGLKVREGSAHAAVPSAWPWEAGGPITS